MKPPLTAKDVRIEGWMKENMDNGYLLSIFQSMTDSGLKFDLLDRKRDGDTIMVKYVISEQECVSIRTYFRILSSLKRIGTVIHEKCIDIATGLSWQDYINDAM